MQQSRVTIRYAKALLYLAIEQNSLEQTYSDILLLESTCFKSKELTLLLKSPIVKTDKKQAILNKIFSEKLNKLSLAFINIIVNKKREGQLYLIAKRFVNLYKAHNKIETATVTTAVEIDENLRHEVLRFIKTHGEKKIDLTEKIDKNIIGGAIIRMGDKQLDVSVSKVIHELKQTFNKNPYIKDF